jgi:hypothetical protein
LKDRTGRLSRAGADDDGIPEEPPAPQISDEEGWRLFGTLPVREGSAVSRPKTRGIWKDADGKERPLKRFPAERCLDQFWTSPGSGTSRLAECLRQFASSLWPASFLYWWWLLVPVDGSGGFGHGT